MASPQQLLEAIIKSDPDVGMIFLRDIALEYGADCAWEYKEEIAKTLPSFYSHARHTLVKRLGRDYIEQIAKGLSPALDPVLLEACDRVTLAYDLVSKYTTDTFEANGNQVTVYRDAKGRFTKKGEKPDTGNRDAMNNIAEQFIQAEPEKESKGRTPQERRWTVPGEWSGAMAPSRKEMKETESQYAARKKWEKDRKAAEAQGAEALADFDANNDKPNEAKVAAGPTLPFAQLGDVPTSMDGRIIYGLQARKILNEATELIQAQVSGADGNGLFNQEGISNKELSRYFDVTATVENASGRKQDVKAEYSSADDAWRLPQAFSSGWAVMDLDVGAAKPWDGIDETDQMLLDSIDQQLVEINPTDKEAIFQHTWNLNNVTSAMKTPPRGTTLDQTKVKRTGTGMQTAGAVLSGLGFTGAGGKLQASAALMNELDQSALRSGMTRAAYRFRGVEAPRVGEDIQRANNEPLPEDDGFSAGRRQYMSTMYGPRAAEGESDAIAMGQRRDYTSAALANRMKQRQSNIGMGTFFESSGANYNRLAQDIAQGMGRGMPSEGVLTDRDGNIVSQSMGIAHDNFLPFNAEALAKLNGGQYTRTRQLGGLTGEDIRTLLVGNGRAGQVVSNSGIYELEFDPSLRGKQRYNPQTMQMIDTYDRILNQIANGGRYAVPLGPKEDAAARQRAATRAGGNPKQYEAEYEAAKAEQYNMMARVTPEEVEAIANTTGQAAAIEFANRYGENYNGNKVVPRELLGNQKRYVDQAVNGEIARAQQDKVRALTLNSEGYALALKTLQQFYPYMIRTARYRPWEQFKNEFAAGETGEGRQRIVPMPGLLTQRGGEDKWYTPQGMLRPSGGKDDELAAKLGTPKLLATREQGMLKRPEIQAGMRVTAPKVDAEGKPITAAGGGAALGGGRGALGGGSPTLANYSANMAKDVQRDVSSITNLKHSNETKVAINDTTIGEAADTATATRMLLQWYGQSPENASAFLARDSAASKKVREALMDESVARTIVADAEKPMANGKALTEQDMFNVMQAVSLASAASQIGKTAQTVSPDTANASEIPEGKGAVVIDDTGLAPTEVAAKIQSNPLLKRAQSFYQGISTANKLSPSSPYEPLDAVVAAASEYQKALTGGYGEETATALGNATGDKARAEVLLKKGIINQKVKGYIDQVIDTAAGPANGILGPNSEQVVENLSRIYRMGHGLDIQSRMGERSAAPASVEEGGKKFLGPLTAPLQEHSKSAGLSDLQRQLLWDGVRSLQQSYQQQH